jgi:hypothetical protein
MSAPRLLTSFTVAVSVVVHGGAEVLGQLDDGRAQAAGAGVDEHLLTGLDICALQEDLPRARATSGTAAAS